MVEEKSKGIGFKTKVIFAILARVLIILAGTGINYYLKYFKPNVTGNKDYLYIPPGFEFMVVYSI